MSLGSFIGSSTVRPSVTQEPQWKFISRGDIAPSQRGTPVAPGCLTRRAKHWQDAIIEQSIAPAPEMSAAGVRLRRLDTKRRHARTNGTTGCLCHRSALTRRAKHWHTDIIDTNLLTRADIVRRGFFRGRCEPDGGRRLAATHLLDTRSGSADRRAVVRPHC